MKVAGFVLAGGQSSRMGQNKARLLLDSYYLIETIAETVLQVTDSVSIIGSEKYTDLGLECLPDLRPGLGPLAGIETALASGQPASRDKLNVIVGCDMPGLEASWLQKLLSTSQETGALCVAAKDVSQKVHPLCAVYRGACLPHVQEALDARRLRLHELLAKLDAVEVPIEGVIANVNTPDQWAQWQRQYR